MTELLQWNELYGEGGSRRKKSLSYFMWMTFTCTKMVLSIPNFCALVLNPRQIAALVDMLSRYLVCTMKYRFSSYNCIPKLVLRGYNDRFSFPGLESGCNFCAAIVLFCLHLPFYQLELDSPIFELLIE